MYFSLLENEIEKQLFVFCLEKWQSKTDWNNNFFCQQTHHTVKEEWTIVMLVHGKNKIVLPTILFFIYTIGNMNRIK